jgi:hypothetical protein
MRMHQLQLHRFVTVFLSIRLLTRSLKQRSRKKYVTKQSEAASLLVGVPDWQGTETGETL